MVKSPASRFKRRVRLISGIILKVIIIFLFLIVIIIFLLQTSFVQNFGRKRIQAYLVSKLNTKVIIGEFSVDFPKNIVLKNIYLEDRHRDTLLSAGSINLGVNLWGLFHHKIVVNNIQLDHWTVNMERQLPDSVFNYAFVLKAFASGDTSQKKTTEGSPWIFELGKIHLVNIRAHFKDDATGNDATFFLSDLQTTIKTFDPDKLIFAVPGFSIKGLNGNLRLYKPTLLLPKEENDQRPSTAEALAKAVNPPTPAKAGSGGQSGQRPADNNPIHLQLGKIALDSILVAYSDEPNNTKANLDIGGLTILANSIDLNKMQFDLKSLVLNH